MDPAIRNLPVFDPFWVARTGAARLAQLTGKNGRFRYSYDSQTMTVSKSYNLLRHCGTIWSMMEVSNRLGPLPDVASAANRAMEWLITEKIMPYRDGPARCMVDKDNVKLGGGGLAILALVELAEAKPEKRFIELARDLGEYILLQRKDDGDFIHKRNYWTDKPNDFVSNYYTGEALFGLLRLYHATGDRSWYEEARSSELRLAERDYGVPERSHWMLYALEQFQRIDPQPLYREHARRIADSIIFSGAGRDTNRSTPMACYSEALLAYVRLCRRLPASAAIEYEIEECMAVVRENLELQLAYRLPDGGFIRGRGKTDVQIDYIQHNISAFLGFGLLQESSPLIAATIPGR
jgi:hypothetical protein